MKKEKMLEYFIQGITIIVTLYEISRTGKRSRRK